MPLHHGKGQRCEFVLHSRGQRGWIYIATWSPQPRIGWHNEVAFYMAEGGNGTSFANDSLMPFSLGVEAAIEFMSLKNLPKKVHWLALWAPGGHICVGQFAMAMPDTQGEPSNGG